MLKGSIVVVHCCDWSVRFFAVAFWFGVWLVVAITTDNENEIIFEKKTQLRDSNLSRLHVVIAMGQLN